MRFKVGEKIIGQHVDYGNMFIVAGTVNEVCNNGEGTIAALPFYIIEMIPEVNATYLEDLIRKDGLIVIHERYAIPFDENVWNKVWPKIKKAYELRKESQKLLTEAIEAI